MIPRMGLPRGFRDLRGRVLGGRYAISELLSVTARHVVYGATDRKRASSVLLRLMRPPADEDPAVVDRLKDRAEAARKASPVRTRPPIDAGASEDGTLYFVCMRPPGCSLVQYMAKHPGGRLPWSQAKGLLQSFAVVLAAAHARGVVHGGITADSFWIEEPRGGGPVAYLVDLGASGGAGAEDEGRPGRATVGVADLEFAAPETTDGGAPDARTDVHLLGSMAFFMLTGQPPPRGKELLAVASMRDVVPGIPEGAVRLIERMLAVVPGERPQTMGELVRELAGVADEVSEGGGEVQERVPAGWFPPVEGTEAMSTEELAPLHWEEPPLLREPPSIQGTERLTLEDLAALHWQKESKTAVPEGDSRHEVSSTEGTVRLAMADWLGGETVEPSLGGERRVVDEERAGSSGCAAGGRGTVRLDGSVLEELDGGAEGQEGVQRAPSAEDKGEVISVEMLRALREEWAERRGGDH